MSCFVVSIFSGGLTVVTHGKDANGCGQRAILAFLQRDAGAQLMDGDAFATADIVQAFPHFRFQPHAGAVARDNDVVADKTAATDGLGCLLVGWLRGCVARGVRDGVGFCEHGENPFFGEKFG